MKRTTRSKPQVVKVGQVTVRIYKRKRPTTTGKFRTIFDVEDYTTGARRFRGFSDHTEAVGEAERIAKSLATGKTTAAELSNEEAASYGRAVELLRPTGTSLEVACSVFAKCFEILGSDRMIEAARHFIRNDPDKVTRRAIADAVLELVEQRTKRGKSADYVNDLRQRLTRFAGAFGANPSVITDPDWRDADGKDTRNRGVDISTIRTADIQGWLNKLTLGTQSVKNFRTVIHTLFEFAQRAGYIAEGRNPVARTESVKAVNGDIQIFTPDEIAKLLKAASPRFMPLVAIGAFAGLRSAEVERIEWHDIDLASGFITVNADKAKTKSRRLVPIQPNLALWLASYANNTGKVWEATSNDLQDERAACVKAAGVEWKPNALRHSYISYRLASVQDAAKVALEAGNSPNVVFKHYRELVKPAVATAWFAVAPEQPGGAR